MDQVEEARIVQALTDDFARRVVRACKESQTSAGIIKILKQFQPQVTDDNYWEKIAGDSIRRLSSLGGLVFTNGQWKSSRAWLEMLDKYFGGT